MGPGREDAENPDRMFQNGNRIAFETPVNAEDKAWWLEAFFKKHGLTPEDVGDRLSNSWSGEKSIVVTVLDGHARRASFRVQGAFGDGDFWLHERTLDMRGVVINADRMFVSEGRRGEGFGRRFMGDLVEFARLVDIPVIRLDAEQIGRYAWLRVGFVPDRGSWNRLSVELTHRLSAALGDLGQDRFNEILQMIRSPHPETARELAALEDEVASLELFNADGRPEMVTLGRALFLEIGSNWSGELRVADPGTQRIMDVYLGDRDP
jgi:GNAT superfamily N-acetyltransferase